MLRLVLSKDWLKSRDAIFERIAADAADQKGNRILIVPELISHDSERRLCAAAGDTASRYAEVLSFTRLVRRVSDYVGLGVEPCMDNGGRIVAMAAAARQLHSKLKAYASVETKPEFLTDLVDAVDEFKRCCIGAEELMTVSRQTSGTLAQKLEELGLLLEAYDSLCARGQRDPRDQMNWVLEQLEDSNFAENHVFYIDGFPDLTRQHLAILEHLIRFSPQVTVGLNCDCVDSGHMAFQKAGKTASQLVDCARNAGVPVAVEILPGRLDVLNPVRESLFQGKLPKQDVLASCLQTGIAGSVFDEVTGAAEQILQLVHSGCRYRDISVVCSDMLAYEPVVSLVFRRCGIPIYLSGTENVLQRSVIHSVLAALEAALGGFEQRDVLRYLKSFLSPLDTDSCDRVENYALIWGIRGKRWEEPWTQHPNGLGELWTDAANESLKELNELRSLAVKPLMELKQDIHSGKTVSDQIMGLYRFLDRIGMEKKLHTLADEMDRVGDNRSAQILNQLWEILLSAMEQMYDVLGQTALDPEGFVGLFSLLLSQYDVGTIPPVLDSVMVGPVSAMRCQEEKYLFVLGADEGLLPGYGGSKGVLTDQERTALREMGVPLTGGAMEGIQAEFSEIYGVFCGATERIWVSSAGPQPSYIFRRLADMSGGEKKLQPDLGAALSDPVEAGAWLSRRDGADQAEQLAVKPWYDWIRSRVDYELGSVSSDSIRRLYGDCLHLSASQIDRQAECRMSYFLKYGLRAKECKEVTVDPAEFGTYVHAVLEQTAARVKALGGFHRVSLEETLDIAAEVSDAYAAERFSQLESERIGFLFRRNRQELELIVQELWEELHESEFVPEDFELAFGENGKMPAIHIPGAQMDALLRGFVDRVDIWKDSGVQFFRVVDYKTGKKDFDYCDVFNGVGLQMLLYLFALEQEGDEILGNRPIPAGVQYFPARVPFLSADGMLTEDQAQQLRRKEWKRRGLLLMDERVLHAMDPGENLDRLCCTVKKDGSISGDLADREQFTRLKQYVFSILGSMVDEIASGNVEPNPYTRGTSHDACAFCPYGQICHKASVAGRRNYKAMNAQRFWEEIDRKVIDNG